MKHYITLTERDTGDKIKLELGTFGIEDGNGSDNVIVVPKYGVRLKVIENVDTINRLSKFSVGLKEEFEKPKTTKVYELYDGMNERVVSLHRTLRGALDAMIVLMSTEVNGLVGAFSDDDKADINIRYSVTTIEVKE